jgi:prevent-host-death family protein
MPHRGLAGALCRRAPRSVEKLDQTLQQRAVTDLLRQPFSSYKARPWKPSSVIDRARRDEVPTIITRRGRQEAVVLDVDEYRRLRRIAEEAEEARLNRLADEAEAEGTEGSASLEEMAALLRDHHG